MNQFIQIFLIVMMMSLPIVFFWIYMANLEKRANRTIKFYSNEFSEIYSDLNVWIKNFDVFKKNKNFDLDSHKTLYSFNHCDLILNDNNIVVIGKTKILGKNKTLTPTIFEFKKNGTAIESRHIYIKRIRESGIDIEIEFVDECYINTMTLVIKRPDVELKEKIIICATTNDLLNDESSG